MATSKKTVLITGANKGIGLETARQLAGLGYFVYIGCRDQAKGQAAVRELNAAGITEVAVLAIDVTAASSIKAARQELEGKIERLDVLVNNAGISGPMPQAATTVPVDTVREVFETNFFGVIQVTQEFLGLLGKSAQPRIVNVSSDLGSLTDHSDPAWKYYDVKLAAYCSSKTALNAYTVMLAYDLRDKPFKVNSVNPGYTATDFNDHQGPLTPEQAAKVLVRFATLDENGPTGKFFSEEGETAW
ncbi:MAG: SDR family oxidoreductase [Hymenobacter sp.]|nr:SDR family oxidoreductase [Hymenobacter sp.]